MHEMTIVSVGVIDEGDDNVVILREKRGLRLLAIQIGDVEANSIAMEIEGIRLSRPMTHDLLHHVIRRLQARVERVSIHDLRDETFVSQLELDTEMGVLEIDARPSDAIALALRCKAPIYCAGDVLELASVDHEALQPDEDEIL